MFCDRDGVIIRDLGYLSNPQEIEILEGVPKAIRLLKEHSFRVIVVTNQSGVARGLFPESAVGEVNQSINLRMSREGATIDSFYYCPHHLDATIARYRVACDCRKPKPGMLLRAADDLGIDLTRSFMVGDKPSDVVAGRSAGASPIMISSSAVPVSCSEERPDWVTDTLLAAARWILDRDAR